MFDIILGLSLFIITIGYVVAPLFEKECMDEE